VRISAPLHTRMPVRVALPVARVAARRVRAPRTVRTVAPAPLAGIALPVWVARRETNLRRDRY
jgi:hypothetical protein